MLAQLLSHDPTPSPRASNVTAVEPVGMGEGMNAAKPAQL
jgi:hypothetical protein